MTMASANWAELMEPGLKAIFNRHMKKLPDYRKQLFSVQTSTKQVETTLGTGNLGVMDEWSASGNQVSYEDVNKGFKQTYTHSKFSKGLQLERELVDDDQYSEITKRTNLLAQAVYYTYQTKAASVFNNAFSGSYLGSDSKPLCSDSHPVSPGSATTYDNNGTLALNADNLETVRTAMMAWKDDKGNLLAVNPDTILVPPALRKAALVIADSDGEPDVSDNNVNVWKGSLKVIECPFLTDSNAWFVMDSMRQKAFLRWFDRRIPQLERQKDKEDFDTEVA